MTKQSSSRTVRIGGASAAWGDSSVAVPQLLQRGQVDYLVFDYLAELTMSILAAARQKNPAHGYATDFVEVTMKSMLGEIRRQGVRVVSNAGGLNPRGCADAIEAIATELGISVRIAVVEGDDVMPLLPQLREEGVRELQTGQPLPEKVLTANAYLGALPVKQALDEGADIVLTGRCVDSAVTLGVLMHEFGWSPLDHDRLAQASLAGHVIECGCQATGGLHTDWRDVPGWDDIAYPVIECAGDGSFVVAKPEGTGGLVTPAVIAEQILYEVGDPRQYLLPDVICDFSQVKLETVGPDRVRVSGARGRAPTGSYKVSATYMEGYKATAQLTIVGFEAVEKARRTAEALLTRTRRMFVQAGLGDYAATHLDLLGAESSYGAHSQARDTREVVMRLSVRHPDRRALQLFSREIAAAGTSWATGTAGFSGRPGVSPAIKQYAFLIAKDRLTPTLSLGDAHQTVAVDATGDFCAAPLPAPAGESRDAGEEGVEVPLIRLAYGRSGDKGDICNVGVIARRAAYLPYLRSALSEQAVAAYLSHFVRGPVTRYEAPGFDGLNFVCEQALGGGGMASLRDDPWGKSMAQLLLSMPVRVPAGLLG